MTDEGPQEHVIADAGARRPAPLPLDAAPRGAAPAKGSARRLATLWIGLAVTVVVIVACGTAYLLARWAGEGLDSPGFGLPDPLASTGSLTDLLTPASAWWSGDGAYAVTQSVGTDDRPVVTVYEVATKSIRTLKGYRVVGVEPAAPRIWLVPDRRKTGLADYSEPTTATLLDIAWDGVDTPPSELYLLKLDRDEDPRSDTDARWAAWDGAAGYTVSVEIDVNKGACPAGLRFDKVHSSMNAWPAKVPTDVVTFEPVGWSPSGRYFAVVSVADAAAAAKAIAGYLGESDPDATTGDETWPAWLEREGSLLIFSAETGALVARDAVQLPAARAELGRRGRGVAGPGRRTRAPRPRGRPSEARGAAA